MRKSFVVLGWVASFAGYALWTYGYFATGSPAFLNWGAFAPWWIADFLPNAESEIGMVLACAGMIPIYWPSGAKGSVLLRTEPALVHRDRGEPDRRRS